MIIAITDINVCIFSFLLVSWVVVSWAPAACDSFADAIGAPQLGQDGAESEISLLHSGQFISAMTIPLLVIVLIGAIGRLLHDLNLNAAE